MAANRPWRGEEPGMGECLKGFVVNGASHLWLAAGEVWKRYTALPGARGSE